MKIMKKILLSVSMLFAMSINAQITDCSELFISEYVEGSGNNKALEIYNPTSSTIDLSSYMIIRYSNGTTDASALNAIQLTGILLANDVHVGVIEKVDPAGTGQESPVADSLQSKADAFYCPDYNISKAWYFNGNDAIVLAKGSVNDILNAVTVDVFGKVGEDPGVAWTDDAASGFTQGSWWTANHTLIRKSSVLVGVTQNPLLFDPSSEWDSIPEDSWADLGSHICNCGNVSVVNNTKEVSYIVYPNPANFGEVINVNTTANIESIDVINLLGKRILTERDNKIKTNKLAKGIYIIMINLNDGKVLENKIIIE
tara:strand:+ start:106 stop:1047 length:942 start_codon:yes stop_codon:yes gene_type:complete